MQNRALQDLCQTANDLKGKNILFVTDVTQPGGVSTYIRNLAVFARTNGWDVFILVDDNIGILSLYQELVELNFKVYKEKIRKQCRSLQKKILLKLVDQHKIKLVHVHCGSVRGMLTMRELIIQIKLPLLHTEQYVSTESTYNKSEIDRIGEIYRKTNCVIAVSKNNSEVLTKIIGVDNTNITIIPNSTDIVDRERHKKWPQGDNYQFLFLGRFVKQKGLDILLNAVFHLSDSAKSKCEFHLYGNGQEEAVLKTFVRKHELEKHVRFFDWVTDPCSLYDQYDAFVLPSRSEGQPFALLEAISHSLPCIASDASGIQEVFDNNRYGTCFAAGNYMELAAVLEDFIDNSLPFQKKVKDAVGFIAENFNNEINLKKTLDLWISILDNGNG